MKVASIIVDVLAKGTDRPFDYIIPQSLEDVIVKGMRVIVPFGPRKIQGFVIDIKESSDVARLKEIDEMVDLQPVLTEELLRLGKWLTEETLCYAMSAFQAMLPAAMKAKYDKEISLPSEEVKHQLHESVRPLFSKGSIRFSDMKNHPAAPYLLKDISKNFLDVTYIVKNRVNKKMMRGVMLSPSMKQEDIEKYMDGLGKKGEKQKFVLQYMLAQKEKISVKHLKDELGITDAPIKSLISKGFLEKIEIELYRNPFAEREFQKTSALPLTEEQSKVIKPIHTSIEEDKHNVFLLYGVTGSGKTEVYLQSIQRVLEKGEEAIVLVPEISLTPQMVTRFKGRFGSKVAVLHSGLSAGEKYDEWRKIQRGEVSVVVGARSAIFAPFKNLGIIIIDEEHESSYKQEENPRYHARDVAIYRGKYHNCPVVLGSATPTLESFARGSKGNYTLLTLSKRMNNAQMPQVEKVDMREELRNGNRSMFSTVLFEKMKDRLEKGEQIVLMLNKRGHSSFIMCRDCGFVPTCPHCEISLTYHRHQNLMKCHYCGHQEQLATKCPECESDHIRYFGTGTQKVEEELTKVIPEASVVRMDVDTTSRKGSHEKLLARFESGQAQILLGTQMIAKGLDFENVTLVGVLSADTMLHLPDFRASEKTFQLLTQVSGRAGRHSLPGEVVIQTYTPEHYSIDLASYHDYDAFYKKEMVMRKMLKYPPFYYLALVTVAHENMAVAMGETDKIASFLQNKLSSNAIILGAVPSPIAKIKDRYRYQCMIKYRNEPDLFSSLHFLLEQYKGKMQKQNLTINVDLNPYVMM
jgi:primosomal protein N' (replication factor Y)